jgi:hypothetical protein
VTRQRELTHRYVEFIPKDLDEGVLYISLRFRTASHLCCCGCRGKVVTPLNPAKWHLQDHGGSVSLTPSVGNGAFACRSHYWVRQGRVMWCAPMTNAQTARAHWLDEYASQVYTGERRPEPPRSEETPHVEERPNWVAGLLEWWHRFLVWLGVRRQ